jgi:hypothetical protein
VESHSHRRLSGTLVAAALVAIGATRLALASAGGAEQFGIFALVGGTPKIVSTFWAEHREGLTSELKVRQFSSGGKKPILNYDVDMERLMHLVVVRDDFATFVHLHPSFDTTTGTFSQPFTKETNHRYYVYADSTPRGIGQQVFRFTIDSDGPLSLSAPDLSQSLRTVAAGPYAITLSRTSLPAKQAKDVNVTISQNGQPAHGLGTYLGAAAHVVFINTSTLAYVHLHPRARGSGSSMMGMAMEMGAAAGPRMTMTVPPLPAGVYKLWIQFRGANDTVYTAPFTMLVR